MYQERGLFRITEETVRVNKTGRRTGGQLVVPGIEILLNIERNQGLLSLLLLT